MINLEELKKLAEDMQFSTEEISFNLAELGYNIEKLLDVVEAAEVLRTANMLYGYPQFPEQYFSEFQLLSEKLKALEALNG